LPDGYLSYKVILPNPKFWYVIRISTDNVIVFKVVSPTFSGLLHSQISEACRIFEITADLHMFLLHGVIIFD